ncbi:MAG TPA: hypothetical protein VIY48_01805 [Candidatus Paceibacterota bacterium]
MTTQEGATGVTEADVTHYAEDDDPELNIGEPVEYDLETTEEADN